MRIDRRVYHGSVRRQCRSREQEFNSLMAQREAAEAYIVSQPEEGWKALPEAEVKAKRVDCVVVYITLIGYDDGGFSRREHGSPRAQTVVGAVAARLCRNHRPPGP